MYDFQKRKKKLDGQSDKQMFSILLKQKIFEKKVLKNKNYKKKIINENYKKIFYK